MRPIAVYSGLPWSRPLIVGRLSCSNKLGWHYQTIRKGLKELETGVIQSDAFERRGRKSAESKLKHLERDIRAIADPRSQTDPTFRTTKLYRKLTGKEARQRLIDDFG